MAPASVAKELADCGIEALKLCANLGHRSLVMPTWGHGFRQGKKEKTKTVLDFFRYGYLVGDFMQFYLDR
jgi:hypothetical protein